MTLPNGWEERKLNNVARIYDGTHQTPKYVEQGVPFYSVEHLTGKGFSKTKFISEVVYNKECKRVRIEKNDVLMTRIGDIGTAKLIDWDVKASFYVSLALIKLDKEIDPAFFSQYIAGKPFQAELFKRTIHVAFPKKINLGDIGTCNLCYPPLPEQKKIAEILGSVDQAIEATRAVIDQTKQVKKGLLQTLLTRGIGHTKFKPSPLGDIPESWEVKALRELVKPNRSISYGIVQTGPNIPDGVPCVRVVDIVKQDPCVSNMIRTTQSISESYKKTILEAGDIMMALRGEIGHAVAVTKELVGGNLTRGLALISVKTNMIERSFLLQALRSSAIKKDILNRVNGSALKEIPLSQLRKVNVTVPPLSEQKEIAKILEGVDTQIKSETDKLASLEQLKKGLMQDLLAGEVRVC